MQLCDLCEISQSKQSTRTHRASKILTMEGQTERKCDSVGECTPSKCRRLTAMSPSVLQ